jgi:hypothetical protein
VRPASRAALAVGAVAVAVVLAVVVAADDDDHGGRRAQPAGAQGTPGAKVAFDDEAGVGFGLKGRVLTVSLHPTAPSNTRNRVNGARIRATCGQAFAESPGPGPGPEPRQERTRLWPAGSERVRFRFAGDISRIARWCRLEDPVVGHVAFVKFRGGTVSSEQRIERIGNGWARLFGTGSPSCSYETQPVCMRIACERPGNVPIENCTPPSAEFRDSFRDATVDEIAIKGDRAAARFSNGEVIELGEDLTGFEHAGVWWWITKVGGNAGRGFFEK